VAVPAHKLDAAAWKVIAVAILGPFMTQLDATIVNVSLSAITADLHSSVARSQWVITGYLLALALVLPLNAWLVDRLGCKKLYLLCFGFFTAASVLCGMAGTMSALIAARVLQGIAGGLLAPLAQLTMTRVAGRQLARVGGYAAVPILFAPLAGPLLAGLIVQHLGWPWLFYVNLPVGIASIALAAYWLPPDEPGAAKHPLDVPGFLLIAPGMAALLYGLEQAAHRESGAWILLPGVCLCLLFLWHVRRRGEKALIDVELFRIRTFSYATLSQFLAIGILYGGQFLIPFYVTAGGHQGAAQAGWILGCMGVGMLCIYPFMGWITDRYGCRAVVTGGVLVNLAGTLPFLWMAAHQFSAPLASIALVLRGLGQGATGLPSLAAAYAAVPHERLGLATMTVNIIQRLGGPIITTVIAIAVSLSVGSPTAMAQDFLVPFVVLTVVQLLVIATAVRLPVRIHAQSAA
jgi:EmrB/QacA subfamily drug resistance transporter